MEIEGSIVFAKKTIKRTTDKPSLLLLNAYPNNSWLLLDKKGFCEDILTKQAHSGQENLTGLGKETLTRILFNEFNIKKAIGDLYGQQEYDNNFSSSHNFSKLST